MEGDFRVGDWLVRPDLNRIEREGEKRPVEPKVMDVLVYLAGHPKQVLPKERLIQAVWFDTFVGDEVLSRAIGELRKALGDDAQSPTYIETIPRRGYRLIAPVVEETRVAETRYRILEEVGHGAMGKVFLAEDKLLKRRVALKFLVEELAEDERARKRFVREARAAAALDHPYVCSVHDTGELGGRTFIAMEYMEGQTLKERMAKGPMSFSETMRIVSEVAEALEKAHTAGVIHRDLKPANIMLTPDGHAKVMDFGLAKQIVTEEDGSQDLSSTLTREGVVVGTLTYMSPEQVRGEVVDHRSDIFSLGAVLYEMLTGVHPFRRDTGAGTVAALVKEEPLRTSEARKGIPPRVDAIVQKALAKEADSRYQSIGEMRQELAELALPHDRKPARQLRAAIMALGAVAAIVAAVWLAGSIFHRDQTPRQIRVIQLSQGGTFEADPCWSPDGKFVAFSSNRSGNMDIWVIPSDGGEPIQVTHDPAGDFLPDWSPDGKRIVFRSDRAGGGIFLIEAFGGSPQKIVSFGTSPQWSPEGRRILFQKDAPIGVPGAQGYIYSLEENGYRELPFLPDVINFAFRWHPGGHHVSVLSDHWTRGVASPTDDRYLRGNLWILPLDTDEWIRCKRSRDYLQRIGFQGELLFPDPVSFVWIDSGEGLLMRAMHEMVIDLWKVSVDPDSFEWIDGPVRITSSPSTEVTFDLSPDQQRVVFWDAEGSPAEFWMLPFDPVEGRVLGEARVLSQSGKSLFDPDFSADGKRLAYCAYRTREEFELWEMDVETDRRVKLMTGAWNPRWSRDGTQIAFRLHNSIWTVPSGGGEVREISTLPRGAGGPSDWTADGKWILWMTGQTIGRIPLEAAPQAENKEEVFASDQSFSLWNPRLSPDERWILFQVTSGEPVNTSRILVMPSTGGERIPVTDEGFWDDVPHWSPDGRAVYFASNRSGSDIWGIRFDPAAGRPIGEPFQVTDLGAQGKTLSRQVEYWDFAVSSEWLALQVHGSAYARLWVLEDLGL